jgi:hypothetical protein
VVAVVYSTDLTVGADPAFTGSAFEPILVFDGPPLALDPFIFILFCPYFFKRRFLKIVIQESIPWDLGILHSCLTKQKKPAREIPVAGWKVAFLRFEIIYTRGGTRRGSSGDGTMPILKNKPRGMCAPVVDGLNGKKLNQTGTGR